MPVPLWGKKRFTRFKRFRAHHSPDSEAKLNIPFLALTTLAYSSLLDPARGSWDELVAKQAKLGKTSMDLQKLMYSSVAFIPWPLLFLAKLHTRLNYRLLCQTSDAEVFALRTWLLAGKHFTGNILFNL